MKTRDICPALWGGSMGIRLWSHDTFVYRPLQQTFVSCVIPPHSRDAPNSGSRCEKSEESEPGHSKVGASGSKVAVRRNAPARPGPRSIGGNVLFLTAIDPVNCHVIGAVTAGVANTKQRVTESKKGLIG